LEQGDWIAAQVGNQLVHLSLRSNSPASTPASTAYAPPASAWTANRASLADGGRRAYEFQTPRFASLLRLLQPYGLPRMVGRITPIGWRRAEHWQEWRAGTDPTDPRSVLRLLTPVPGPTGVTVSWLSVAIGRISWSGARTWAWPRLSCR